MMYTPNGASHGHAVFVIGYAYEEWRWTYTVTCSDGSSFIYNEYEFYEWDLILDPQGDGTVGCTLAREYSKDINGNVSDNGYPGMEDVGYYSY